MTKSTIEFARINNDVNGNPRHVVHFLQMLTKQELHSDLLSWSGVKYDLAILRGKTVGGRKYHNKSYVGCIVFQEYSSCMKGLVNRAFELFEQSKPYIDAYGLLLAVVNDRKRYMKCFDLAKSMMKPLPSTRLGFTQILREVQDTAEHMRKTYNVRTSKDAQFIAACMLCIEMERVIKERKL